MTSSSLIPPPSSLAGKPRLRLPAYGKALLNARRLGEHPLVVHVIYGEEWRPGERCGDGCEGASHPRLAVRPSEFEPWTIDWRVVTGCKVVVFDPYETGAARRNFYELLGELGRFAGPVEVYRLEADGRWAWWSTSHVLAAQLWSVNGTWPAWWPIETERINAERRERWFRLSAAHLEQRSEAAA